MLSFHVSDPGQILFRVHASCEDEKWILQKLYDSLKEVKSKYMIDDILHNLAQEVGESQKRILWLLRKMMHGWNIQEINGVHWSSDDGYSVHIIVE